MNIQMNKISFFVFGTAEQLIKAGTGVIYKIAN